ncbi:PepSY-associated TM helix domain-containing protein [Salmonirosea aquatica]|uniref:PepSY domain-containing protein n=1 Tax=Salmonirosea aquatica TaxID=2654236 RepID=A0A7C9FNK6_9BACT|nr:PepSY domain-containing protein [Cytophagaceae bacterium SJW1-29]
MYKPGRLLFSIHSWLGLITGFFLILLGLSGSMLVFMEELDPVIYRSALAVKPEGTPLSLDSLYHIITTHYPNLDGIAWMNPEASPEHSYQFRLYMNDMRLISYDLGAININQYTGQVLRQGRSDDLEVGWIEWLFQFHFSLHLGMPGAALTAIFGLCMLASLFTGVVVYRRFVWKVLTFRMRINRKSWRTVTSDLHRIVGVWSLGLNALIFFTGFWLNLFAFEKKTWDNETIPTPANTLAQVSLQDLYGQALQKAPDFTPDYVYLPTQPQRKFSVRGYYHDENRLFSGSNAIVFDAYTGKFEGLTRYSDLSGGEKIEATVHPLHVGNYGGTFVKVLYVILGLTPGFLSVTGFLLWWRHKRKKTSKRLITATR